MKKYILSIQPWTWQCGDGCCSDSGTDVNLLCKEDHESVYLPVWESEYCGRSYVDSVSHKSIKGDLLEDFFEKIIPDEQIEAFIEEAKCKSDESLPDKEVVELFKKFDIEFKIERHFEEAK